jgi:thiaminase
MARLSLKKKTNVLHIIKAIIDRRREFVEWETGMFNEIYKQLGITQEDVRKWEEQVYGTDIKQK